MKSPFFIFGLRAKLLLLSLFLFAIPLLGYQYVWEMEKYLRVGQEKTLMGTVRAVATALHERPQLFDKQASFLPSVQKGRDLYAYPIIDPIRLDGNVDEWRNQDYALTYQADYLIEGGEYYQPETLSFQHMVGKYKRYLYAYFKVTDNSIIYRPNNSLKIDQNDLLNIAFITPLGDFRRYIISTKQAGWLTPYELIDGQSNINSATLKPENRIQGVWKETPQGYNIELRIPLSLLGGQLSFAITDIDAKRQQAITIGTAEFTEPEQLGSVLVPSPEIEKIIQGLGHSESRLWVLDKHGRVLAQAGDINNTNNMWSKLVEVDTTTTWFTPIQTQLSNLYNMVLTTPSNDFNDELYNVAKLEGSHIKQALTGKGAATWRLTTDKKAVVLSAAYPVYNAGEVQGVVIAEETTNGIRSLRNKALQGWFNVILAVMGLGTLALFIFASRISSRIRALRDQTEQAIDEQGRIIQVIKTTTASDEVGDLQRSFASMVDRLGQYTQYLQGMSARLSHELRTPVAVVKTSLESLEMDMPASENNVYMQRAKEGISRLSTILTLMSEATRLEQTIENTEASTFLLEEVISGCVQGYELTQPHQAFSINIHLPKLLTMTGSPDLLAQLLDKLLANAVEFANTDSVITINVALCDKPHDSKNHAQQYIKITIANQGICLPEQMQERLFDSMVSVRKAFGAAQPTKIQSKQIQPTQSTRSTKESTKQIEQPHLGLGLYIAKLITQYHQGSIELVNKKDQTGVEAIVILPILSTSTLVT
jgi:dedicated sortase system histidine kinase